VGAVRTGPDTGDGQFFVSLTDNVALDFDATAVAKVVKGLEVVDRILEGDVIERIRRR
jgi:cyclophilin family peptidyl-prolyl cis-trans isomerase